MAKIYKVQAKLYSSDVERTIICKGAAHFEERCPFPLETNDCIIYVDLVKNCRCLAVSARTGHNKRRDGKHQANRYDPDEKITHHYPHYTEIYPRVLPFCLGDVPNPLQGKLRFADDDPHWGEVDDDGLCDMLDLLRKTLG